MLLLDLYDLFQPIPIEKLTSIADNVRWFLFKYLKQKYLNQIIKFRMSPQIEFIADPKLDFLNVKFIILDLN